MFFQSKILLFCSLLLVATVTSSPAANQVETDTTKLYEPTFPELVLFTAFHKSDDGTESCEIGNGAWAFYWYGHRFELDGKQYFAGFMYKTPDNPSAVEGELSPPPAGVDDQVSLAQATFVQNPPTEEKRWLLVSTQQGLGKFGGLILGQEKGLDVDSEQKPETYLTPAGNYLLAVPTSTLVGQGISQSTREIFLFNKKTKNWLYAGSIEAGKNNDAGCASDKDTQDQPPCFSSTAKLEFIPQSGSDMPLIRVHLEGTTSEGSNKVRKLGPQDAQDYLFNSKTKKYRKVAH